MPENCELIFDLTPITISDIILAATCIAIIIYTVLTYKIWKSFLAQLEFLKAQVEPILEIEGSASDKESMAFKVKNVGAPISTIDFVSQENHLLVFTNARGGNVNFWNTEELLSFVIRHADRLPPDSFKSPPEFDMHYTNANGIRKTQRLIFKIGRKSPYP